MQNQKLFYLAVTDLNWFRFLKSESLKNPLIEINFWKPSASTFKAIAPGTPVLFKLKELNVIGGGGIFVSYQKNPLRSTWDLFKQGNGAQNYDAFLKNISSINQQLDANREIGSILLEAPVFFDVDMESKDEVLHVPASFAKSIVCGKTYTTDHIDSFDILNAYLAKRQKYLSQQIKDSSSAQNIFEWDQYLQTRLDDLERGIIPSGNYEYLTRGRIGQNIFRAQVLQAYDNKCAITQEHTSPVLQAAHIKPYAQGGEHRLDNALLLRSDFHILYDQGYLAVDRTLSGSFFLLASPLIYDHFNNGLKYSARNEQSIFVPKDPKLQPSKEMLQWHLDHVFKHHSA
jgi:putative restriction endonuclease